MSKQEKKESTVLTKKTPSLRFKQDDGSDFPDWEERRLGDIGETFSGLSGKTKDDFGKGKPFIQYMQIFSSAIINTSNFGLVRIRNGEKQTKVRLGDILFTTSSETAEEIGCSSVLIENVEEVYLNSFCFGYRPYSLSQLYPNFSAYLFRSELFRKKIIKLAQGSTRYNMSKVQLMNIHVNIPVIEEQQKIGSFLQSVDTKIQLLERKVTLLQSYKKGVMQKLFSQELRFKDEQGNEYPDWEFLRGDEIFKSISNRDHNSDLPILAISQEYGAIPREFIDLEIIVSENSISTYKVVEKGDFIISLRSFQGGIEYSNYKGICSPAYIILRSIIKINDYYFKSYFKTFKYIQELNKKLEGIRDGKMISYKYFSEIKLPVPSLPEQQKIASFLQSLDTKISLTQKQVALTKQYKKGLLQRMFV